jgi:uncharacterized membrane protein
MIDDRAADRVRAFTSELADVRVDSTSRNGSVSALGAALQVIGVVTCIVAVALSQLTDNPLEQSTDISLGLAGVALVVAGAALFLRYSFGQFLRFWMLRLTLELQDRDAHRE